MGNPNYDNCILGAGIAGLIAFYYLTETTKTRNVLITKSLESEANTRFQLGPRFLKYSRDTEALLKRLGLSTATREIFVGWKRNGEIRNCPDLHLGPVDSPSFTAFQITQTELAKVLLEKCVTTGVIIDDITSINYKKITTKKNIYFANHIISTIPLNLLTGLLSNSSMAIKISVKKDDWYFFLVDEKEKDSFDYIYGSPTDPWYRKTYISETSQWVYETNKVEPFVAIFQEWIIGKGIKISLDQNANLNIKELGTNINLVGRYGQMNHNIRTEDVIHWAHNYTRKFKKKD